MTQYETGKKEIQFSEAKPDSGIDKTEQYKWLIIFSDEQTRPKKIREYQI